MLSRLGQVNHYYVDVYYADRWCGFPQSEFAGMGLTSPGLTAVSS